MHPFSAMLAKVLKLWKIQSRKFGTILQIKSILKLSLGFREKFTRVDFIHDFRLEFADKTWRVNNLIYGISDKKYHFLMPFYFIFTTSMFLPICAGTFYPNLCAQIKQFQNSCTIITTIAFIKITLHTELLGAPIAHYFFSLGMDLSHLFHRPPFHTDHLKERKSIEGGNKLPYKLFFVRSKLYRFLSWSKQN